MSTDLALQETKSDPSAVVESMSSRAAAEVQAAMVVAKRFPRDETAAIRRIETACKRTKLAEMSQYEYSRGGSSITGPSVRLLEELARAWGNIDFGVIELDTKPGESSMMAYCWDLETNTRSTKVFTAKHTRTARGSTYALTDPRDVYESNANLAARRMRACMEAVIPGDVLESSVAWCNETLMKEGGDEPLIDRVRKMVSAFDEKFTVTKEMLEKRLGHNIEATSLLELSNLRKIFQSLLDGMSTRETFFPTEQAEDLDALADRLEGAEKKPKASKPKRDKKKAPSKTKAAANRVALLVNATEKIAACEDLGDLDTVRSDLLGDPDLTDEYRREFKNLCDDRAVALGYEEK